MPQQPPCPHCGSSYAYEQEDSLVCPDCGLVWRPTPEDELMPGSGGTAGTSESEGVP
jgi:uncharacterized Zn ribbon protein